MSGFRRIVIHVAAKELRELLRDGRATLAAAALLALTAAAALLGAQDVGQRTEQYRTAVASDQRIWQSQGARNPHSAAHFGQYAFKPVPALAALEPGMDPWLGTAVWMEAHYQNAAAFRPAEDRSGRTGIGQFSAALVLQYLLPLLLIFAGHAMVAGERERGTAMSIRAGGVGLRPWLFGKWLALSIMALALWLPAALAAVWLASGEGSARGLLWSGGYLVYSIAIAALVVLTSALCRSARNALLVLLGAWALAALVVPRAGASLAEAMAPSVDPQRFWSDVAEAMEHGIDGRGDRTARTEALRARVLAEHGVDREERLPVAFAGLALQAEEEYGNVVFDLFHGRLLDRQRQQRQILRTLMPLSPLLPIKAVSMAMAGTDEHHHRQFTLAAESHRRTLQRFLNEDLALNAVGHGHGYRSAPSLWSRTPRYEHAPPPLRALAGEYWPDALALLLWLTVGALGLALAGADREERPA